MATTRIIPMHINQGKTIAQCLKARVDYVKNPDKTDSGRLITSYECDSRTADAEFLLSKREYLQNTGRERGKDGVSRWCEALRAFFPAAYPRMLKLTERIR